MKLIGAGASPFVRKVRVLMFETDMADRIDYEAVPGTTPIEPDGTVLKTNPLAKIPCFVTDDGSVLYDSRVIGEYIDSLHGGAKMIPDGTARWSVLRRQALGDGIMDAGVSMRYETALRPEQYRWDEWVAGQQRKIENGIAAVADDVAALGDGVDVGAIACACAIAYIDFRFADIDWRQGRDGLAAWYEAFSARPSMQATQPT